jgi:nucleotide sugar dehydrogenase
MKVSVMGMGYVGFPLACAIAKKTNFQVIGYDISEEKIKKIKNRISPVEDFNAEEDIKTVNIFATKNIEDIKDSDFILICVPTPIKENKDPDLSPVISATESILPYIKDNQVIVLESTVNPGVCDEEVYPILKKSKKKFHLAHCPERIDPGNKKYNVYNIARNIGSTSPESTKIVAEFYRTFIDAEINEMSSLKAVEATKIIENTFRDINIAYVNELAKSFDIMNLDIVEVINGAKNKPFAFMAHYPGCGVGGHCIPVDPYYLIKKANDLGFDHKFLRKAREVNNSMPHYAVKKLMLALNKIKMPINGTKIGLLGLSYKANIGDLRESPALEIKKELESLGADLYIHDPYVEWTKSLGEVLENCEAVLVATNHSKFIKIEDWKKIKIIIDGRNCLDKDKIKNEGIIYSGIGR